MPKKRRHARKATTHADVYTKVTDAIIAQLDENSIVPWRRPWTTGMPLSMSTRRPYRGVNPFLLGIAASIAGYTSPWWATYDQIAKKGGQVRRGELSTLVILWRTGTRTVENDDGEDEVKGWATLTNYRVFNACQADGLDDKWLHSPADGEQTSDPLTPLELADTLLESYFAEGPTLRHGGDRAYYSPGRDHVQLPERERFVSPEAFYSTAFHEATHSTGHATRLNRVGIIEGHHFGDELYAAEELVAEMGAAMLCGIAGVDQVDTLPASAAYIDNWLGALRGDKKLVVRAAAAAQKAADLVAGVSFATEEELLAGAA